MGLRRRFRRSPHRGSALWPASAKGSVPVAHRRAGGPRAVRVRLVQRGGSRPPALAAVARGLVPRRPSNERDKPPRYGPDKDAQSQAHFRPAVLTVGPLKGSRSRCGTISRVRIAYTGGVSMAGQLVRVGARQFREDLAQYLDSPTPIAITRHGQTVGYYLPARRKIDEQELREIGRAHV